MPDEPVIEETPVGSVVEAVVEETPVETTVVEPHPLEPGGKRFQEVYGDWRREQLARERAEAEVAAYRAQAQQAQKPAGPVIYTPQQLQQAVDQGLVTPMVAADILARQNAEAYSTRTAIQVEQARTLAQKQQAAGTEVNQYIDKIPSLRDTGSAEFRKVSDAAYRISDDMGLPVTDFRVQRTALREVYGSLDKFAQAGADRETSRKASLPHVESTPGSRNPAGPKVDDAWKKDIPERYFEFWKKRGYSEAQMKDEAKYVGPTR